MLEKIALQKKLISEKDCRDAADACKSSENFEDALKDYFLSRDLISPKILEQLINTIDAIKTVKKNIKFGTVAMEMGLISKETLDAALDHQKKAVAENHQPRLIGRILYDSGKLTKEQLQLVIKEQNKRNLKVEIVKKEIHIQPKIHVIPKKESISESETESDSEPGLEKKEENRDIPETIQDGIALNIEDGGMSAFLRKTEGFNDTLTADDIINLLLSGNIQYGVESTHAIETFISSSGFKKNRFKVASGTPKIIGSNARIEYYFNTDHLLVGKIDEEGNIDLMERGEIPRVEAKTLLAEKFPLVESKNGRDIFGRELTAEPAIDIPLKIQTGVILSEDGLRAYSEISGHPKLSWSGNLSVVDTFVLNGDVSYKTGNLSYYGNIEIQGGLKSGFRVKGFDIKINEVDGGEIHAQGDVTIINGLNDAVIYSRGHVSAKYVYNSKIFCLGNLYVDREIGDSEIESSGSCRNVTGAVINSTISFSQGVQAKNIGAEKSTPSMIIVGRDQFIMNELENIGIKIKEIEKDRLNLEKKKEKLLSDNKGLYQSITQMASEFEKIMADKQDMDQKLSLFSTQPGKKDEARQLKIDLKQKEAISARLDKELNDRLNFIEKNESELIKIDHAFEEIEILIDDLNQEKMNFADWSRSNPGKPVVIATGKVFAGTVIQGVHSQKEIIDTIGNVRINEVPLQINDTDSNIYEIRINDNKSGR
ncbi:MAG: FapA family protein [Desulfobacula sp.]|jgi:hypothetical protein